MAAKRKQPRWWIAVSILIVGLFSLLGKLQIGPVINSTSTDEQTAQKDVPDHNIPARQAGTIRIATFNIQVFGTSKLENPTVIRRLASLIRQFDLVAIQEIRSVDQTVIPQFVNLVNENGDHYQYLLGDRLGRTSSKEQYAFFYRASLMEPIYGSVYNIEDRQDRIHREPLIGTFRIRDAGGKEPFQFTLINIHTDPDEAEWEVAQTAEVYRFVKSYNQDEDDVIVLGDLNVAAPKLTPLTEIPLLRSVIGSTPTNTARNSQYDHILVDHQNTLEFTGRAGVLDMASFLKVSDQEALELSDHQPVWAEFYTDERRGPEQIASPFDERTVR